MHLFAFIGGTPPTPASPPLPTTPGNIGKRIYFSLLSNTFTPRNDWTHWMCPLNLKPTNVGKRLPPRVIQLWQKWMSCNLLKFHRLFFFQLCFHNLRKASIWKITFKSAKYSVKIMILLFDCRFWHQTGWGRFVTIPNFPSQ